MSIELIHEIVLAAAFGALQQALQHWFPWRLVLRMELPRVAAYVIGTLAYLVPITVLFSTWSQSGRSISSLAHLVAIWSCVVASGGSVVVVRSVDWVVDLVWSAREANQREKAALVGLSEALRES